MSTSRRIIRRVIEETCQWSLSGPGEFERWDTEDQLDQWLLTSGVETISGIKIAPNKQIEKGDLKVIYDALEPYSVSGPDLEQPLISYCVKLLPDLRELMTPLSDSA